jgi:hypothetical protein
VVEGTGFENRQGSQARAGSNPASSARKKQHNDRSLCFLFKISDQGQHFEMNIQCPNDQQQMQNIIRIEPYPPLP